ncbi:inositol monophosphatase family protein [Candidatus Raskinella chloraquaticus]|uniref:Inositol-1-monophosphatase n=1 Tax=Candidatus Raskinella chloraquaticus TaxID=1951219 RepID=A0A1W9I4H1_9HYPH|nr:MAG: inositol monophosphatase [Proteobacteria bacterium SG_bin8]
MQRSATLNVMVEAVRKAGRGLARDFGEVENLQVSIKGPGDFVSAADRRAEETIRQVLEHARPGYGLVMEEAGIIEGSDRTHRWHIDPLDGTTNFLHGIPHFAVSLGLEREGVMIAGVVLNPITNELFVAERGKGAYIDGRRLRVSARSDLSRTVIGTGVPHMGRGNHANYVEELKLVMARVAGIRRFGAAALDLAFVAAGRFDGFWERGLSSWDMAAGIVLVRESGGLVSDFSDRDNMLKDGDVVAGNETVHGELLRLLAPAR